MEPLKSPASDYESEMRGHKSNKRDNNTKNKKNKKETLIPIDDFYSLGADEHCWKILTRVTRKRKGVEVKEWQAIKWYSNLNNALNGLVNFKLRVSGVETFTKLQKEQERVLKELSEAVQRYMGVA